MSRTDIHRPADFVPANYVHILSYSLPGGDGGACNTDCTRPVCAFGICIEGHPHSGDNCCLRRLQETGKIAGYGGKCTVCGARFRHGDVWLHEPTGEHIHLGHDCADKYAMHADRSEWELECGRLAQAKATWLIREAKREQREAFLTANPGLAEDLQCEHSIVQDIAKRFSEFATLSPKQIELVRKLAAEARNPAPVEVNLPAPEGKVGFCGEIVSKKSYEGMYGTQVKITVKVREEAGVWFCWLTLPSDAYGCERGEVLQLHATLTRGRDQHFAIGKRPTLLHSWVQESAKLRKLRAAEAKPSTSD
jgi:hypothetical protein